MSGLTLLAMFHVFVAFLLIAFVLLQDPKGGGAAGVFGGGGGSNSLFGASGAASFLSTLTKWAAIIFAVTSVATTYITSSKSGSVMDDVAVPDAPIESGMDPVGKDRTSEPVEPAESSDQGTESK
jgi:preprotein translocase subunit SecG